MEELIVKRINKLVEETNREFAGQWKIKDTGMLSNFQLHVEPALKRPFDYTREELLEMIKKALIICTEKKKGYEKSLYMLMQPEYVHKNKEALVKIRFDAALKSAEIHIDDLMDCFAPIRASLKKHDSTWNAKDIHARVDFNWFDTIKFLKGEK